MTCRPIGSGASIIYCIYVISVAIAYVTLIKNYLLTYLLTYCSVNKGADQLRSNCAVIFGFVFAYAKTVFFSWRGSYGICIKHRLGSTRAYQSLRYLHEARLSQSAPWAHSDARYVNVRKVLVL